MGTNITKNGTIANTSFSSINTSTAMSKSHIEELRNAVTKLETYVTHIDNCGNCSASNCCQSCETCESSSCQSSPCQSTPCQTQTCQTQTCQTTPCQSCQSCETCESCQSIYTQSCSCFIAGTKVLCYNEITKLNYYKNIEELITNDIVIGANGMKNKVLGLYKNILGDSRSIMTFEDNSIYFSDEHPFWVKDNDGTEWFGVHNYNSYYKEKFLKDKDGYTILDHEIAETLNIQLTHIDGIKKEPIIICGEILYGTINGYKKHIARIDRAFQSNTKIYHPIVDGNHTVFLNNYLVGSFARDDYDYTKIDCNKKIELNMED